MRAVKSDYDFELKARAIKDVQYPTWSIYFTSHSVGLVPIDFFKLNVTLKVELVAFISFSL